MGLSIDDSYLTREKFLKNIAGEVIFSSNPGKCLRKWRETFIISQKRLAKELGMNSSVICDYEGGRRQSPGIKIVRKYISALISIDEKSGGKTLKNYLKSIQPPTQNQVILGIKEFFSGVPVNDFCKLLGSDILAGNKQKSQEVYGYTVIDSVKAISELSFTELVKLYGSTTQRALIFTKVTTGRTPMVAIKLTNLKPGLVILHGLNEVDDLARVIAEDEKIPLALCKLNSVEEILEKLKTIE